MILTKMHKKNQKFVKIGTSTKKRGSRDENLYINPATWYLILDTREN